MTKPNFICFSSWYVSRLLSSCWCNVITIWPLV